MRRFSRGPNTIFEYRPGMSIGDMGGAFVRATVATYVDATGLLKTAAAGVVRDGHFINSQRTLLLEAARTNAVLWSRDVTQSTWQRNFLTATSNAIGCDGVANTASTVVEDTSNNAHFTRQVNGVTITSGAPQSIYVVLKANGRTKGAFYLQSTAPTTNDRFGVNYDLAAGTITSNFIQGAGVTLRSSITALANGFFLISVTGTLGTSTQAVNVVRLFDASGNATYTGDGVSGIILDYQGHEVDQSTWSTPIATNASTATRNRDELAFPFGSGPAQMTAYVKFIELGNIIGANAQGPLSPWTISSGSSPTIETWRTYTTTTPSYSTRHVSIAAGVNSSSAIAPNLNDTVELRSVLFSNGSVQLGQCVNGGAEVVSAQSGAAAFDADWSGRTLSVNMMSGGVTGTPGFMALQSLRFVLGVQSMATMQYDFYTAITSDTAEFVHLIELQYSGGTQRLCTGVQDITWNGFSWQNVGGLLSIGGIEETTDSKGQGVDLKLSGVDQTVLAALLTNSYRGRPVTIWRAHLNRGTGVIAGDPTMLFSGLQLSPYTVEEDRDFGGGTVTISTRMSGYFGIERVRGIQTNVTSHSHVYNGDTFFQNCATLQNKKIYWGTAIPQTPGTTGGSSVGGEEGDPGANKFKP